MLPFCLSASVSLHICGAHRLSGILEKNISVFSVSQNFHISSPLARANAVIASSSKNNKVVINNLAPANMIQYMAPIVFW